MMRAVDEARMLSDEYAHSVAEKFRAGARAAAERGEQEYGTRIRVELWDRVARELRSDGYRVHNTWLKAEQCGDNKLYWYMKLEWGPRMTTSERGCLFAVIVFVALVFGLAQFVGDGTPTKKPGYEHTVTAPEKP